MLGMPARKPQRPPARLTGRKRISGRSRWEGYGGPARPSPTIGQCLNGGLGWQVECNRCKTRASLATRSDPPAAGYADLETRGRTKMPVLPEGPLRAAGAHDQADDDTGNHAVQMGASRRGSLTIDVVLPSKQEF
jgi:hypothetical protein